MAQAIIPLAPGMRASYQHLGKELLGVGPEGITFGVGILGQAKFADGSAAAPSLTFASAPTSGMYNDGGVLGFSVLGEAKARLFGGQLDLIPGYLLSWNNDTFLVRDAANVLALKNGTNAQEFRVYGTTTGNKYASITHNGNTATIGVSGGGSLVFSGTHLKMWNIATPAAEAGAAVVYCKDAGAGKMGLYVIFPTGVEQQIKVEL